MTKTTSAAIAAVYRFFAKPLFFLLNPEYVHHTLTSIGSLLGQSTVTQRLVKHAFSFESSVLRVKRDGIEFLNPVGLSAGYDWNGELVDILPDVGFGFQTVGTVTWEPYEGNPKPRLGRLPKSKALLVNKGLQNLGAMEVIKKLEKRKFRFPIGISLATTNKKYKNLKEQLSDLRNSFIAFEKSQVAHSYYELNISCPNTFGGEPFTTCPRLEVLLDALDSLRIKKPVYVKMPIDLSAKETRKLLATAGKHAWVKGVVFGNLTKDHNNPDVHPEERKLWSSMKGNVSGKPTYARSLAHIQMAHKEFGERFTVIGTGGIFSPEDALEKLRTGAHLVQLITGMIYQGPQLIGQINHYLAEHQEWKSGGKARISR